MAESSDLKLTALYGLSVVMTGNTHAQHASPWCILTPQIEPLNELKITNNENITSSAGLYLSSVGISKFPMLY